MKVCAKCKIEKIDDDFSASQFKLYFGKCKLCLKLYNKQYNDKNKEHRAKNQKNYAEKNKEKISEYQKLYIINHKNEIKEKGKQYRINNKKEVNKINKFKYKKYKNKILLSQKQYYCDNKDKKLEYQKEYYKKHKIKVSEYRNKYRKKLRENNLFFKLKASISCHIRNSLKANNLSKKGKSVKEYLPYTILELKNHLEKQFEPWMNWQNWGVYDINTWDDNYDKTWKWQIDHIIPQSFLKFKSVEDDNFKKCWALENLRPYSAKQNIKDGKKRIISI